MRSQVQSRLGQLLLLACALNLAISQHCRDDSDDIASECPNEEDHFVVRKIGCPDRFFCYLQLRDFCNVYQEESRCAEGLSCSCDQCMNCDKFDNCFTELCPKKRAPLLPWYFPRWVQVLARYKYPSGYFKESSKISPLRRPHRPHYPWTNPSPIGINAY